MKSFASLGLVCVAACSGVALAACLVDLSNLSGGTPDGGGPDDAGNGGGSTSSGPGSTTGAGGAASSSTGAGTASSGGSGGAMNPVCGAAAVLDCSACACPAGGCAAVPLATGNDALGPRAVAVSSDGVFWSDTSDGRIMGILAPGGAPQVVVKASNPTALAVASGRIVYAALDGLWTCLIPSCATTKDHLATSIAPGSVKSVAYDGQLVYWADRGDNDVMGNGNVWSCDPAAGCVALHMIAGQQLHPQGLFLTGDSIFWMVQGNGNANGSLHKSPRTGVGQTDLAAALVLPGGLAADDTYVYWTQATVTGAVMRCDHTLGYCNAPQNIAPAAGPLGLPSDLALSGGRIYWNENSKGTISSCPVPACGAAEMPLVHATGRQGVSHVAAGSSCLFWIDGVNGGTVDKVGR
jgi:hypothetical protein